MKKKPQRELYRGGENKDEREFQKAHKNSASITEPAIN